jgi:hypothetical protein
MNWNFSYPQSRQLLILLVFSALLVRMRIREFWAKSEMMIRSFFQLSAKLPVRSPRGFAETLAIMRITAIGFPYSTHSLHTKILFDTFGINAPC